MVRAVDNAVLSAAILLLPSLGVAQSSDLSTPLSEYQSRYPLNDPLGKLINDHGKVPKEAKVANPAQLSQDLRGVRNFRAALSGIVYRGGKISPADTPKDNRNPPSSAATNPIASRWPGYERIA